MNVLSPSLLAADFMNLEKELQGITDGGARYLHIDVMDGHFVLSISFGMLLLKFMRSRTELLFDD